MASTAPQQTANKAAVVDDDDGLAVRCAACEQREDALDNLSRRRFRVNTACGHYLCVFLGVGCV